MSKAEIFNKIRRGLHRGEPTAEQRAVALARIQAHKPVLIPARAQLDHAAQVELFRTMATQAAAKIIELNHLSELPQKVTEWLQHQQFKQLVSASDNWINDLDWSPLGDIQRVQRVAQSGDRASLTGCMAGIAETGTLMLHSGNSSPTTLNFLPDCHLVVLRESQVVGSYEDAWQLLRKTHPDGMPRTVNMITGPSRSADIGQKLQMGAHGPCELVIFLLKESH
ncbi:LutC/YkgG family protein [Pontibacter sp. JAM-7]|uniref:LutC/YkgG family protein n=1 Tax=Pontibacter sp. JAM-7 TaxID=3366581 RepID=UPI003AF89489